jgi:hypothetical protein
MIPRHLALLILTLPLTAFSAEITVNCDSRVINQKTCTTLLQDSLKTVGCTSSGVHCILHPWGSDFIKSWICSSQSNNCSLSLQTACPAGSTHTFNEVVDVCADSKTQPVSVHGVCGHEHAEHSIAVKTCTDGPATCAKFGGFPAKCSQPEGHSDQWEVSCGFPSLQVTETGTSCSELQAKCELTNTEKGVKSRLLNCFR